MAVKDFFFWVYTRWYFWFIILLWIFMIIYYGNSPFRFEPIFILSSLLAQIILLTFVFAMFYLVYHKGYRNGLRDGGIKGKKSQ